MPALSPSEIADRLGSYSTRLRTGSLTRAMALWATWQSYNDVQNPLRDDRLPRHPSATALNLLASAALHETIIILVRAFDQAGGRGPLRSDKVSFPILLDLTWIDGVREELELRARLWLPDGWQADENANACTAALDDLGTTLERLRTEEPNRQKRLRDFRDEFLAHNLEFDEDRSRPLIGDITALLSELVVLSDAAELAFNGNNVHWDMLQQDVSASAASLWEVIRHGAA